MIVQTRCQPSSPLRQSRNWHRVKSKPRSHRSICQISTETGISQSSVFRIIHKDLRFKCLKRSCVQELTEANRPMWLQYAMLLRQPAEQVDFMWFTDENIFMVATPKNPQNNQLYVPATMDEISISFLTLLFLHLRLTEITSNHNLFGVMSIVLCQDLKKFSFKGNQTFALVTFLEAKLQVGAIGSVEIWAQLMYDELMSDRNMTNSMWNCCQT